MKNLIYQMTFILIFIFIINCRTLSNSSDFENLTEYDYFDMIPENLVLNNIEILGIDDQNEKKILDKKIKDNLRIFFIENKIFNQIYLTKETNLEKKIFYINLKFTQYKFFRTHYFLAMPLAALTLGIYYGFYGTVETDDIHFKAEMEILDSNQKIIFSSVKEIIEERNINYRSPERKYPYGANEIRTRLIVLLLEDYKKFKGYK